MYCEAETVSTENRITYSWPKTLGGETAMITCPLNNSNVSMVMRNCSDEGLWYSFNDDGCDIDSQQLDGSGINGSSTNVRVHIII